VSLLPCPAEVTAGMSRQRTSRGLAGREALPSDRQGRSEDERWRTFAAAGAIAVVGALIYSNSLSGPFIFDDTNAIVHNPNVRQLWPIWRAGWAPRDTTVAGRPTISLSLALNYALGGLDVTGYHLLNLGVHLAAAVALFGVLRRTLLSERLRATFGPAATSLSAAAAMIWLAHPLQTESVTYVIQRAESIMGMFFLLTLYCAIRGFASAHPWRWHGAAIAFCALGMGSKEVMVVAPVIVLLYDRTFVSGSFRRSLRCRWGLYAGLAGTWGILAALVASGPRTLSAGFGLGSLSPWAYGRSQFGVILHYLALSLWPARLCLDYYDWPSADSVGRVLPQAIVVLSLLALSVWGGFRRRAWGFVGLWFFLLLAPSSSIVPIRDLAAEHRMYLPLAALVVPVVAGAFLAGRYARRKLGLRPGLGRSLGLAAAGAAVACLGYLTYLRNAHYRSEVSIWKDTVAKRRSNPRARYNLGTALSRQGRLDEAIGHFLEAVRIKPDYGLAHNNLGNALAARARYVEAIRHYRLAIRFKPGRALIHCNLAGALMRNGQTDEAIREYSEAIRIQPDYAKAHNGLGVALAATGRLPEAIAHYRLAIRHEPGFAGAYYNLGAAYANQGEIGKAAEQFAKALRIRPDFAHARDALARCRAALRQLP